VNSPDGALLDAGEPRPSCDRLLHDAVLEHKRAQTRCLRGHSWGCAPLVIVRKRSWPAVSQICSLIHLLSSRIFLILKSILQGFCPDRHQCHVLQRRTLGSPRPGLLRLLRTRWW